MTVRVYIEAAGMICSAIAISSCAASGPEPSPVGTESARPLRIVCIGDSLTTCGGSGGRFTDFLGAWLPQDEVINKGVGGDTLAGGRSRFGRDVLDLEPDVVVIELGANDYWAASRPLKDLRADLDFMVRASRDAGAQVVIASCFGGSEGTIGTEGPTGDRRAAYAAGIAGFERDIARQYDVFYVPSMQVDIKPNGRAPYWSDRNHPNRQGNELVAKRILAQLKPAIERARSQVDGGP